MAHLIVLATAASTSDISLFPLPKNFSSTPGCLDFDPATFTIDFDAGATPTAAGKLLLAAVTRYRSIVLSDTQNPSAYCKCSDDAAASRTLKPLKIDVAAKALQAAAVPAYGDDEAYSLIVDANESTLAANSIWGALRGLETFSQLIVGRETTIASISSTAAASSATSSVVCAADVRIDDAPRFPHRGLMIDTSRRFLPTPLILAALDAMAYAKLNVLHWHVVDDESFPLESSVYPKLSERGAYNAPRNTHVYSAADVASVIAAATARGIRVIPELDAPGHATSWFKGYPELRTSCPGTTGVFSRPMDPISPVVNTFMRALWKEVNGNFPDHYVHVGGDEVNGDCWGANATIAQYMKDHGLKTYGELQAVFEKAVIAGNAQDGKRSIIWQENFAGLSGYPSGTVVNVWKGASAVAAMTMRNVTKAGYDALFTCKEWYFDYQPYAVDARINDEAEWAAVYRVEPLPKPLVASDSHVMGGEACMWAPVEDGSNWFQVTFPRTLAVAERLWSPRTTTNVTSAKARGADLRCRYLARGLAIPPVHYGIGKGGDYCPTPAPFSYKAPY